MILLAPHAERNSQMRDPRHSARRAPLLEAGTFANIAALVQDRRALIREAADLIYHSLVLWRTRCAHRALQGGRRGRARFFRSHGLRDHDPPQRTGGRGTLRRQTDHALRLRLSRQPGLIKLATEIIERERRLRAASVGSHSLTRRGGSGLARPDVPFRLALKGNGTALIVLCERITEAGQ